MFRLLFLALVLAAALAHAATALAGGWATVQLSSTPDGTRAGDPWNVELTVLQHGRTPLEGIAPTIRVRSGGDERTFSATATGKPGVYQAQVVFPAAGTWQWEIWDGFSQTHTYYPVEIGPADGVGGGDGIEWWAPVLGVGVLGLAGLGVIAALRRRRPDVRVA